MTFDEILLQVRELLERDGRVAYRILKRRFELSDEDLEDLKADLIDAKRLAVDEGGKVLVWAGSPASSVQSLVSKTVNLPDARRQTRDLTVAPDRGIASWIARRAELAPETNDAFQAFSKQVFAEGALSEREKQLIAVAVAHVTQCPYCIRGHTRLAQRKGASEQEIMEAIWVAAEMRAGGAYAHSVIALDALS